MPFNLMHSQSNVFWMRCQKRKYSADFWYLNKSWQDFPKFFLLFLHLTADEERNLSYQCGRLSSLQGTAHYSAAYIEYFILTFHCYWSASAQRKLFPLLSVLNTSQFKVFFSILLNLSSSFLRHLNWSLQSSPLSFLKAAYFQYFVSFPIKQVFCSPGWNSLLQLTLCRKFNSFSAFHCLILTISNGGIFCEKIRARDSVPNRATLDFNNNLC